MFYFGEICNWKLYIIFIITTYIFVQRGETILKLYETQNYIVKNRANVEGINYIM